MPQKTAVGSIILSDLAQKIDRAAQKIVGLGGEKVRFITLYGSACECRMKEDSDIDISVYYDDDDTSEFRLKVLLISLKMSMISRSSSSFLFRYACRF